MTPYEQRLQKEAEEIFSILIADGSHWKDCENRLIIEPVEKIAAHLLAKQAETAEDAHRVGYMCKAEGDNIGLSRKTYLIETGLVPQIDNNEKTNV